MTTFTFAPEHEEQVKSLDEVRKRLAGKYKLDSAPCNISDLTVSTEKPDEASPPRWNLHQGDSKWQMTERAFRGLLNRLAIPPRFAMSIPDDLVDTIVRRLKQVKPQTVTAHTREGVVYGLTPGGYHPPNLLGILESIDPELEIARAKVGTDGFRLETMSKTLQTEVKKGDVVKVGLFIGGCDSGRPVPRAQLMTYRLVCTNGAVAGKLSGALRWPRKNGESLELFRTGLAELVSSQERLAGERKLLSTREMTDFEFARLWKTTRKIVGPDAADRLLDMDKEARQAVLATVKAHRKEHLGEQTLADVGAYDRFNLLSAFANTKTLGG